MQPISAYGTLQHVTLRHAGGFWKIGRLVGSECWLASNSSWNPGNVSHGGFALSDTMTYPARCEHDHWRREGAREGGREAGRGPITPGLIVLQGTHSQVWVACCAPGI